MIRGSILGLIAAAAVPFSVAADPNLCNIIQQYPSTGLFGLYYQTDPHSPWLAATDWAYGQQNSTPQFSMPRRSIKFALVARPFSPRTGVLNIRVRTEAIGPQPDASRVNVQREAVREPCGFGGRYYHLREFSGSIPTRIYESYHDPKAPVVSSELDQFHFYYKPDQGACIYTNAGNRGPSFQFLSIPDELTTGMDSRDIARAVNPPALDTRMAIITESVANAVAAVSPFEGSRRSTPGQAPQSTHYTRLLSLLRKYDSRTTGQDCIAFDILPSANEVRSYVSMTDFDAAPYGSSYSADHWQINWQNQ
jgi:hypothetical protein